MKSSKVQSKKQRYASHVNRLKTKAVRLAQARSPPPRSRPPGCPSSHAGPNVPAPHCQPTPFGQNPKCHFHLAVTPTTPCSFNGLCRIPTSTRRSNPTPLLKAGHTERPLCPQSPARKARNGSPGLATRWHRIPQSQLPSSIGTQAPAEKVWLLQTGRRAQPPQQ